ncbi:MAG: hypothetical protein JW958_05105 [Candidatus Eisenbacteria bacterium]|nr:hypothetical protein [Candidatus Eisenbacteria bacterium]
MERLSRIYFSESGAAAEGGESPPAPVAFVPVLNGAGNGGEVAVESIRRCLDREGVSSLLADFDGEAYRLRGGNGTGLDGPALLDRLRAESDLAVFFLILSAEPEERGLRLLCRGDISLLLVDSEVPSLKAAYLVLKRLNAIERGTMPALLSVSPRRSAWDGLAHRRLAEAAERFLHRRVAVWDAEGPDRTAARIADGLRRMRSRKERGVDPLLRRIAPLVEGDD